MQYLRPKLLVPKLTNIRLLRLISRRKRSARDAFPRCSKANLEKSDCIAQREEYKAKLAMRNPLLYNPDCCVARCQDAFPRFDDLYYKIADKGKRKYMQTWIECPRTKRRKHVLNFDNLELPPVLGRTKQVCPPTPKNFCKHDEAKIKCKGLEKCPYVKRACKFDCRKARLPPSCVKPSRKPSLCKKINAPCPAFSECDRCKLPEGPQNECRCADKYSSCGITKKHGRPKPQCWTVEDK